MQKFVKEANDTSPDEFFCREDTLNEVFGFPEDTHESKHVREVLCSDPGRKFMVDVYETLELRNFQQIVSIGLYIHS